MSESLSKTRAKTAIDLDHGLPVQKEIIVNTFRRLKYY